MKTALAAFVCIGILVIGLCLTLAPLVGGTAHSVKNLLG